MHQLKLKIHKITKAHILFFVYIYREKEIKNEMTKKSTIYKSENKERNGSSSKISASSQSIKNRDMKGSKTETLENSYPLLNNNNENLEDYDDDPTYLEPTQRFPMPDQTPMLSTVSNRPMSNIRTNPHMRLTQV